MKTKFRYNPATCKYEPIIVTGSVFFRQTMAFLGISFCLGLAGLVYFNLHYPLWDETQLEFENVALKTEWNILNDHVGNISDELAALEQNDDNNYRTILDLGPLPASMREAGVGGREHTNASIPYDFIKRSLEKAEKLKNRLDIEGQSLDELENELGKKEKMWASRPAIQPIDNKDLTHLYTLFGARMHPLLGYVRPHKGLDFVAPTNSPIYATGDGRVDFARGGTTYGNVVFINHGYGFETRYAHMTKFVVAEGEKVKRGQLIGYVGNTGLAAGPHLHYEVFFNGNAVNPINFFQQDLSNKEFEKLVELGEKSKTSLD